MTTSTHSVTQAPLSFGQEQLWFLDQLTPGLTTYNILLAARLRGPLDVPVLQRCLSIVVERHEALRVTIRSSEGTPYQVLTAPSEVALEVEAHPGLADDGRERAIEAALEEMSTTPFDLENGPLYRYRVLAFAEDDHVLLQNVHHIITDGWSSGIVNAELAEAYRALTEGREPAFDGPGSRFTESARAQREHMHGETLDEELAFWAERLGDLPTLEFPTDRPRPPAPTRRAHSITRHLPDELLIAARRLAEEHGVSLYMVLVSALNVVLSRYTGQEDVPVGVPMLGRVDPEEETVVGLFVNMVVLRSDLSGDPTFAELLARTMEANFDLYEHQEVPFHLVVDRVQPVRVPGRNPLFQVSMQLLGDANSGGALDLPGIEAEPISLASTGSRFDMAIDFVESGDSLRAVVEYSTDLFDQWRIEALLDHIGSVVTAASGDSSQPLSRLPVVTPAERVELMEWGRGEAAEYSELPLHVAFAEVARATPDAVAVVCRGAELTYGELDRRGDLLARHLRTLGVTHGQVVAIVIDRDLDAYVAMLGVLKAGGAFAMMDPKVPAGRLDFMIRDTAAPVVISRAALADRLPEADGWATVLIDADWAAVEHTPADEPLPDATTRESLAYVLYTSGSTGTPKGVMIAHRAVSFFCEAYRRTFDLGPQDRLLQLPALNFDMSQGEIWTAFLVGARIVAVSPDDAQSPEALTALLRDQRVTYAGLPPAMQSVMEPEPYPDLKYVMGGAEVLPPELVNKWNLPGRKYLNLYGPTECAIGQTEYHVEQIEWTTPPPIGRPQLNRQVYVVDRFDNLVPKGVNGELLIGGAEGGLSRGYLNQPAMTAEKFVTDPFDPDSTVYRSGDLVRWSEHGQIEFLGRIDNQVKLRGLRVELGEIETALQGHPGVLRAVVLMRPDRRGENRLVGYHTSVAEPPSSSALRDHLAESLPDYMVPTAWVALDRFPMNNDGWKINRNALPDPVDEDGDRELAEPQTDTEIEVAKRFAEVLGVERIGRNDSIFDIGGNSLQALRLVSRINKTFKIRITVRLLYGNATVGAISQTIDDLVRARTNG
ncbi:non-ribosomal peptide synthetase [Actinoalloteichus fjordicus]|uniref:Amino acid adenylation enzyme/thioester reductase family protein n=1 Tax=Actinoalloteichus fjordicus TaxID=1612552 RepID=A0AAC9PSW3_9PSEU|nr:non-ribosomal peptide synthetase [Actinoalloteichus fjordicus]APU15455.1 amino acid adenylation enzyme/thioester reductase family protein [Actinoalloteichus fjordicus]